MKSSQAKPDESFNLPEQLRHLEKNIAIFGARIFCTGSAAIAYAENKPIPPEQDLDLVLLCPTTNIGWITSWLKKKLFHLSPYIENLFQLRAEEEINQIKRDIDILIKSYNISFEHTTLDEINQAIDQALIDDTRIRDFTVSALYVDSSGTIHDPTGLGLKDLRDPKRKLRMITDQMLSNAEEIKREKTSDNLVFERLRDDPAKIIRLIKYKSRGFTPVGSLKQASLAKNLATKWSWPEGKKGLEHQLKFLVTLEKAVKNCGYIPSRQDHFIENDKLKVLIDELIILNIFPVFFGTIIYDAGNIIENHHNIVLNLLKIKEKTLQELHQYKNEVETKDQTSLESLNTAETNKEPTTNPEQSSNNKKKKKNNAKKNSLKNSAKKELNQVVELVKTENSLTLTEVQEEKSEASLSPEITAKQLIFIGQLLYNLRNHVYPLLQANAGKKLNDFRKFLSDLAMHKSFNDLDNLGIKGIFFKPGDKKSKIDVKKVDTYIHKLTEKYELLEKFVELALITSHLLIPNKQVQTDVFSKKILSQLGIFDNSSLETFIKNKSWQHGMIKGLHALYELENFDGSVFSEQQFTLFLPHLLEKNELYFNYKVENNLAAVNISCPPHYSFEFHYPLTEKISILYENGNKALKKLCLWDENNLLSMAQATLDILIAEAKLANLESFRIKHNYIKSVLDDEKPKATTEIQKQNIAKKYIELAGKVKERIYLVDVESKELKRHKDAKMQYEAERKKLVHELNYSVKEFEKDILTRAFPELVANFSSKMLSQHAQLINLGSGTSELINCGFFAVNNRRDEPQQNREPNLKNTAPGISPS